MMSAIEWTEATWNPVTGCTVISAGCHNCYAMDLAGKRLRHLDAYDGLTAPRAKGPVWTGEVRLLEERLDQPLVWKRPRVVFVNSMGDLFHQDVPFQFIDQVFATMAVSPRHTYQILTKRAERMCQYINAPERVECVMSLIHERFGRGYNPSWPLENVWLGVSAENQRRANALIPDLLFTNAALRFVSLEPLLDVIDLTMLEDDDLRINALSGKATHVSGANYPCSKLDWVIVGGESGKHARPMRIEHARAIRDACANTNTDFFFKQWGQHNADGRSVGKKTAGRHLDGRLHDCMPPLRATKPKGMTDDEAF